MSSDARTDRLVVDAAGAGERLDVWLARRLPDLSRARIQDLIAQGHIRVDDRAAGASMRIRAAQAVSLHVPSPTPAVPAPEDIALHVVYEDPSLLVIDKPAGIAVHPGAGRSSGTLVNALLHHVHDLSGVGGVLRPGIVHRLDRGTSGLLVVAKTDAAHVALARQFAGRTVEKEYLALVLGVPRAREGTVSAPIGRDPTHRRRMSVRAARGREARSTYRVVEAFDGAALLRVRIHTGRTHQIRVHLASIGHPVAGDATYGGRRPTSSERPATGAALAGLSRPALHATRLAFDHPVTAERRIFDSPLPADLSDVLERLRNG